MPLATIIVPRVTIKGGNFNLEINKPFNRPNKAPTIIINGMTNHNGMPDIYNLPAKTAEAIQTVPTDKSIPPVAITNVAPIAIIA